MIKLKDLLICLGLFIFGFLIWLYKMILASDIPVNITIKELIGLLIVIFIYTTLQYFYLKKFNSNLFLLNLLFTIILLLLWCENLVTALIYNYHIYDTISDIIGLVSVLIIIIIGIPNFRFKSK